MTRVERQIDRVSAEDLMSLVSDGRGTAPTQVGAVLILRATSGCTPSTIVDVFADRLPRIPRLRQRLVRLPVGYGRPIWVDDPDFSLERHLSVVTRRPPVTEDTVLAIAAELLAEPLNPRHPLWAARLITGMAGGRTAIVVAFHHVVADGIAGLAVLRGLTDDAVAPAPDIFPRPAPPHNDLARDALGDRLRSLTRIPSSLRRIFTAGSQLAPALRGRAAASSLNRPTGPVHRYLALHCDLPAVRDAAHRNAATVNDIVLTAVTAALNRALRSRGESLDCLVVSVPFSARTRSTAAALGNQSAVIPLRFPTEGTPAQRLLVTAETTRGAKASGRGASTAILSPLFRILARAGVYQRFIRRQRLVHTFVTNVRGPSDTLTLGGCPIEQMIPLGTIAGNVTVAFAVLSYCDSLVVTLLADQERWPDLPYLQRALGEEIQSLVRLP